MNLLNLKENLRRLKQSRLDEILDVRDSEGFDTAWCQLFETVCDVDVDVKVEKESIFKALSDILSQHEKASYIVDDILLLAKANKKGIDSMFIRYLNQCYEEGLIP